MSKSVNICEDKNIVNIVDNILSEPIEYWNRVYNQCREQAIQEAVEESGRSYIEFMMEQLDEIECIEEEQKIIDLEKRINKKNRPGFLSLIVQQKIEKWYDEYNNPKYDIEGNTQF
jgi:hypothetical protein